MPEPVHVAIAIINQGGRVLVSLRAETAHQGGLWEFPGGKVEAGESSFAAVKREVFEELGITVNNARLFKTILHQYADKSVLLDVWWVESSDAEAQKKLTGKPADNAKGAEGQSVKWQALDQLSVNDFPLANRTIIHALTLSEKYMITGTFETPADFILRLETALKKGISLVQLRCKHLSDSEIVELAAEVQPVCKKYRAKLLLNTRANVFQQTEADGLHLSSQQLYQFKTRPLDYLSLLSVSCHTAEDIEQAEQLGADIILLSPVKETKSHPGVEGIGWNRFSDIVLKTATPVYALGGMSASDVGDAKSAGAQGVAAISSFWKAVAR